MDMENTVVIASGKMEGIVGMNSDGWRLDLVNTIQCTDDVLQNSMPRTCILLLASDTPIN